MAEYRAKIKASAGIIGEFKNFILRGNVMDLAVGVIIGGAFNKIVTSLVNDVVMPLISVVVGPASFNTWFAALDGNTYATVAAAEEAGAPLLKYGSFIATVLDFLLMGFVIFLLVKFLNFVREKFKKDKSAEPDAPATKDCPFCFSPIHINATVCPQCTSHLDTGAAKV